MTTNFDRAFDNVIGIEKGYSNNARDNGGETMWGVTVKLARACGYAGEMKSMSLDTAKDIYRAEFWDKVFGEKLPFPLAEFLFDFAVNSSPGTATKALQRAIGSLPDGSFGPKTLALAQSKRARDIIRLMFVDRALLFAKHEDLDEFGRGWFARLFDVTERFVKEA